MLWLLQVGVPLRVLLYVTVAVNYHQSILIGTPSYSSHSSTALYETYVAGQEESGCLNLNSLHVGVEC